MAHDSRELMKDIIRKLAITARLGVETDEFTKDEAMDYIREEAEKQFNRIFSISDEELAMEALTDILNAMIKKGEGR